MASHVGWGLFFLASLFLFDPAGKRHPKPRRKVFVNNCFSEGCRKTGDTVWLTNIHVGDTLAVSFAVLPSTGYRWDVVREAYLHDLGRKVIDSITKEGENPLRTYIFQFETARAEAFLLKFAFRRGPNDESPRAFCAIMPEFVMK